MIRDRSRASFSVLAAAFLLCHGEPAPADETPVAIPVRELPLLPDLESAEEQVVAATMLGAQLAEDERVVGAAKREQSLGSVASAVTVLTHDQIRRFGYRTLAEALGSVVGVYMTDDRSIERVGIRGVQLLGDANTRILVLIDSSPLNEPWSQYVDTSYALPVHMDDVARIEIIRGPVSSIYGTNAFLGIINIVTISAERAAPAYGRATLDSFGGAGGNAGFALGSVNRQVRGGLSFITRGGETVDYDPFEIVGEDPTTSADGMTAMHGSLTATYNRIFFQVRAHDRDRELPGAPFDSDPGDSGNRDRHQQLMAEASYTQDVGDKVTLSGRAYASTYRFTGELAYDEASFRALGKSLWYGTELRSLVDLSSLMGENRTLDLTTGVSAELTSTSSESFLVGSEAESVDIDQEFDIEGVYAELSSAPASWLGLTAGLRYDRNSLFEDKLNPRAALFLTGGKRYGAKLLYAEGFRNPSIFEAYYEDDRRFLPACSPNCQTAGTELFPEEIVSYEGLVWWRPTLGSKLRVSAWNWDLTALIERRRIFDPTSFSERLQYQNLAELTSRGVEVEGTYRDARGWVGFVNLVYADVLRNAATEPPNSPAVVSKLGVSSPQILGLAHLSTTLAYISARKTRDEEVETDPWLGWDLMAYVPEYRGFDISVGVRNLLGIRQQVPAQGDYDRQGDLIAGLPPTDLLIVPGAGREFLFRLGRRL